MKKIFLIVLITIFVLAYGVFFYVGFEIYLPPGKSAEAKYFKISPGQSVREISSNLKKEDLIRNPWLFIIYLETKGLTSQIKSGDYFLAPNLNLPKVVEIITQGKTAQRKIVIPEGWAIKEIAKYLNEKKIVSEDEFLKAAYSNYNFDFLKDSSRQSLEGFLFPDTYFLPYKTNAYEIAETMLKNFDQKFDQSLREEAKKQNKTISETIILASIIEKEVFKEEDKKIVAGILEKRLALGQPLEVDATINYITGKNNPQSTLEETKIESPYNTYIHTGLPPGPICNPSLSSIKAVLSPKNSLYLYYLTRPDTKETIYSQTFEEHLANQKKYLSF